MKKIKVLFRIVFGRTAFVVLFLLLQIGFLFSCFRWLSNYLVYIYGGMLALTALVVIYILNEKSNPSFKLAWVIPVLVIPVFGTFLYLFVQFQIGTKWINRRLKDAGDETSPYLEQNPITEKRLKKVSRDRANLAVYLKNCGGFPVCQNTSVRYFPLGDAMFPEFKRQLKSARKFIFMEYFIIERGKMWGEILEILEEKAAQGVEVRVMYDGMCSIVLLPLRYPRELEEYGIRAKMFAPIVPFLSTSQNNRDHRKIVVIDGKVAFTGGVNLADEYINKKERFGHWKDVAVKITGDAVRSFTVMYLQMWNVSETGDERYDKYLKDIVFDSSGVHDGFVIPYGETPTRSSEVAKTVYASMFQSASKYVHIMTPYFIVDREFLDAMRYAARRGVEVAMILPHIPDKKVVYYIARTFYPELLEAGIRVYEYTPGFVHAKSFVSDDTSAVVGTVNLDYRSFYHHFECGAYFYESSMAARVEEDFQDTLLKCQEVTIDYYRKIPLYQKVVGRISRMAAPLL